ncbi:MAG: type II secretion system protein [Bacilli bacterium]
MNLTYNKKGFTLIELLAVIVILGVVLAITIPSVTSFISSSKLQTYINHEEMVIKATKNYLLANGSLLPVEIGDTAEIKLSVLQEGGYLDKIISPEDKKTECGGYILITKISDKDYDYATHLDYTNTRNSSTEDKLTLHYTFDDYQEPTSNLYLGPSTPGQYMTSAFNGNYGFGTGTNSKW